MNRKDVEKIINEYVKPIFGFALKRCKNIEDAEDLSQEIAIKAFSAMITRDDIADVGKFIWTIAHNTLSNYYRDTSKYVIGVPIEEVAELISDPNSNLDDDDNSDAIHLLQSEIAYLSKLQRKIVIAYYFENRKQADIAKDLNIPLNTVKWHLFEAKKELKRGMNIMRKTNELKFNPIKFNDYSISGSVGTKSPDEFLRSTLAQNICYCVRNDAKTINEIADDLGVSPVYIETEVEYLEKYGFLQEQKNKYIVNFIISEPTEELFIMQDKMYKQVTELFANELYDELISSDVLDDSNILFGHKDRNFLLWSLIPYIAACSGEHLIDEKIKFDEVATIRPDGAHNIYHTSVGPTEITLPADYVHMRNWCGPMWNGDDKHILWQIDSEWSDRKNNMLVYSDESKRILSLYERELQGERLSKDEYAYLAERGYVKTNGKEGEQFKSQWQIVILANKEIQEKLLSIGERIKVKYLNEFEALKAPYVEAFLKTVPAHLKKVQAFELQYMFHSDGLFILHCIATLIRNGKLKVPTEEQKKSLTTLITNV